MSFEQADLILKHPSVVGISRRRRLYAALVLGSAILIACLVCLSFSVRDFRTVQSIRFSPKSAEPAILEEARQQALEVVRKATAEDQLRQLVAIWTNHLNQASTGGGLDPNQVDYEKLRARLTFALEVDSSAGQVTLQLGYTGRGNREERAFLRLFSERIAEGLRNWGAPTPEQLVGLREGNSGWEQAERSVQQRWRELQRELDQQVERVAKLREFSWDSLPEARANSSRGDDFPIDPRLGQLQEQLVALKQQQGQLLTQYPESHPEVLAVQREREQVQLQISELELSAPKRISNQFVQASFAPQAAVESNAALGEARQLLATLELEKFSGLLDQIHQEEAAMLRAARQQQEAVSALLGQEPRLEVAVNSERVSAFGPLTLQNLLWATAAALALGSVIASRFDVWSFDRGFENIRAASETLSVPVFSWDGKAEVSQAKSPITISARILKLSEIILFTTLLVVAGMMLIDAEYRLAVCENPLHLFARLLWMWKV